MTATPAGSRIPGEYSNIRWPAKPAGITNESGPCVAVSVGAGPPFRPRRRPEPAFVERFACTARPAATLVRRRASATRSSIAPGPMLISPGLRPKCGRGHQGRSKLPRQPTSAPRTSNLNPPTSRSTASANAREESDRNRRSPGGSGVLSRADEFPRASRPSVRRLPVAATVLACVSDVNAAPPPSTTSAPVTASPIVLGPFNLSGGSSSFDLAIEPCHPGATSKGEVLHGCPLRVRLLAGGKVRDGMTFGHPACGELTELEEDSEMVGRPRGVDAAAPARVWTTRADWCDLRLTVRPVRLAPDETGLLVSEVTGTEAVASQHWLFVGHGGRLSAIWSTEDEVLPEADVVLIPTQTGPSEDVVVIQLVTEGGEGQEGHDVVQRIVARRLRWDATASGLVITSLPQVDTPLYLVHVATFANAAAARAAALRPPARCEGAWRQIQKIRRIRQILPGSLFPGLGLRGFILGQVFATRAGAETAASAKEARGCPGVFFPKIIEYVSDVEPLAQFSGHPLKTNE